MTHGRFAEEFEQAVGNGRRKLMEHPLYDRVDCVERLREFMRNHVFAVWDFMSLLKRLQGEVAGCQIPWLPNRKTDSVRFINEIVIGEESDEDSRGGYTSHFELYGDAMAEVGADRVPMDSYLANLRAGRGPRSAFNGVDIPGPTREFVELNLHLALQGRPHEVAAAFCYGREDVIPDMFSRLARALQLQGRRVERFVYYLQRHIELDGDHHGPLSRQLLQHLCGGRREQIDEAIEAARAALTARIRLWDGVLESIDRSANDVA